MTSALGFGFGNRIVQGVVGRGGGGWYEIRAHLKAVKWNLIYVYESSHKLCRPVALSIRNLLCIPLAWQTTPLLMRQVNQ